MEPFSVNNAKMCIDVVNSYDEALYAQGLLSADAVRRSTLSAGVDTRSRLLSLPIEEIEKLGLLGFFAKEHDDEGAPKAVQKMYGPVTVQYEGRSAHALAVASKSRAHALVGDISLI